MDGGVPPSDTADALDLASETRPRTASPNFQAARQITCRRPQTVIGC